MTVVPMLCPICREAIANGQAFRRTSRGQGSPAHATCIREQEIREKGQPPAGIRIGAVVQTERGVGVVRSVTICYLPILVDIFYGDDKAGYCYLTDRKRLGWGRCRAEECQAVASDETRAARAPVRPTLRPT